MPNFRKMSESDLEWIPEGKKREHAKAQLSTGKCEVEESSFTDPGEDYSRYWVDGVAIHYQRGY